MRRIKTLSRRNHTHTHTHTDLSRARRAGRRVIDFADAAARGKSHNAREAARPQKSPMGGERNGAAGGRSNLRRRNGAPARRVSGAVEEEDQRRANSHDVDKVDRWAAASGGSLVSRQASIKVVADVRKAEGKRWRRYSGGPKEEGPRGNL